LRERRSRQSSVPSAHRRKFFLASEPEVKPIAPRCWAIPSSPSHSAL
jgi:hypothetical protein